MEQRERGRPRVSLVVPVKNEARRIEQALAALRAQTLPPVEVLVVDGHSLDGTADLARSCGARVFFEEYGTRAGACQVGVQNAVGDLIAFTDADCVPAANWLETLAANLEDGVVGVGGRIVNEGDTFWQRAVDGPTDGGANQRYMGSCVARRMAFCFRKASRRRSSLGFW